MYPIANMITSIKNAIASEKEYVYVPYSKVKSEILDTFKKTGYISDFKINELTKNKKNIKVFLKYENKKCVLTHLKNLSKPGLRLYCGYKYIPKVLGGIGDIIISTPKGIMTGREAKAKKIGGELICEVY